MLEMFIPFIFDVERIEYLPLLFVETWNFSTALILKIKKQVRPYDICLYFSDEVF